MKTRSLRVFDGLFQENEVKTQIPNHIRIPRETANETILSVSLVCRKKASNMLALSSL